MAVNPLQKLRQILDFSVDEQRERRGTHQGLLDTMAETLTPDSAPAEMAPESRFSCVSVCDGGFAVTVRNHPACRYMQYSAAAVGKALAGALGIGFTDNSADIGRGDFDIALVDKDIGRLEIKGEALARDDVEAKLGKLFSEHFEMAVEKASRASVDRSGS